jgi:hypothetical protein
LYITNKIGYYLYITNKIGYYFISPINQYSTKLYALKRHRHQISFVLNPVVGNYALLYETLVKNVKITIKITGYY